MFEISLTACFLSLWDFFFFFLLNGNLNLFAKWREMSRDASEEHIAA